MVEVCRVVDTVLVDQETVYAPRQSNDRLLLGLKGSLNEYELDLLRQRSLEARREKAKRGELIIAAPVGYRKTDDQRLEKDPEIGSVRQTLLWFLEHGLQLPSLYSTRRDPLEAAELRHRIPDSHQSELWRRVCVWQDRASDAL